MKNKFLHWTPRILSILFVALLFLFSLDGFGQLAGWQLVLGTLIHLAIPVIVLVGVIVAWKRDLVGAVIFFFFVIYYVFMAGFDRPWSWYVSISGPAAIVGILYLLNWFQTRKTSIKK